jgi:hypothetical protein
MFLDEKNQKLTGPLMTIQNKTMTTQQNSTLTHSWIGLYNNALMKEDGFTHQSTTKQNERERRIKKLTPFFLKRDL